MRIHFFYRSNLLITENQQLITPLPLDDDESVEYHEQSSELISPFFPAFYPRDYITEYFLQCESPSKRVYIIFDDFQLSRHSSMIFVNTNGEKYSTSGSTFRPPALISSGASMIIKFNANGGEGLFKANVLCINEEEIDVDLRPHTQECGGLVTSLGGFITMINILNSDDNPIFYDCIWLIKIRSHATQTHLSIKVETLEGMESDSEISIHEGLTSDTKVLEVVRSSRDISVSSKSLVVPISSGLYVRFRGRISHKSRLAIVYTSFSFSSEYFFSFTKKM